MPRSSAPILQTSSNQLVETRAIRPAKKKKARASTSPRPLMQEIKNHFGENRSANSRTCHSGSTRKAANVVSRKIRNLCIFLTCLARVVCVLSPSVLPPGLLFGGIYCAEISFPATGCHVLQLSFALPGYLSQYSSFFPSNYGACVLHAKIVNPSAIRQCNFYCQLRGCLYPVHITKLNDSGTICSGRWITYKHTRTSAFILSLMCQTLDPRPRTKIDSPTKKFTIRETFDLGTHTVSLRARDAHLT
jgi:hypothetical protein